MGSSLIIPILLLCLVVLALVWCALSSCLGDEISSIWSRRATRTPTTYGQQYARLVGSGGGQAGWEHIEMEDMLDERTRQHRDID